MTMYSQQLYCPQCKKYRYPEDETDRAMVDINLSDGAVQVCRACAWSWRFRDPDWELDRL